MTHAVIINLWPSLTDFAGDIGLPYGSVKAMRRRGSIPAGYWTRVVSAAARRQIGNVSYAYLAELAAIPVPEAAE